MAHRRVSVTRFRPTPGRTVPVLVACAVAMLTAGPGAAQTAAPPAAPLAVMGNPSVTVDLSALDALGPPPGGRIVLRPPKAKPARRLAPPKPRPPAAAPEVRVQPLAPPAARPKPAKAAKPRPKPARNAAAIPEPPPMAAAKPAGKPATKDVLEPPAEARRVVAAVKAKNGFDIGRSFRLGFAPGAVRLDDKARSELDKVAIGMHGNDTLRLQLMAYAGSSGATAGRARRISLSRALTVRSYLIGKGVRSTRIDVRALGNRFEGGPAERVDVIVTKR